MTNSTRFYKCEACGNVVGMIEDAGVPLYCCNQKMQHLEPKSSQDCGCKELPKVEVNGKRIHVNVGECKHDMDNNVHTGWVYLETNQGGHRKSLCKENRPEICFELSADEAPHRIFAYCNKHGLWQDNLQAGL